MRLIARSGDYASLTESAITNFVGLVRTIKPEVIELHNPPIKIDKELSRAFKTRRVHFSYPRFTIDTLLNFDSNYASRIVGQARACDRILANLYPLIKPGRDRPVVMMFCGPSGVGKTETTKFISALLGGELMRKQLSMYQNERFASYLFGGHHTEPSFARDLLERDSNVILLDEFDKANDFFHSAFYQLFEDGILEDKNYEVVVGPALIVCTSNYASEEEVRNALGEALYSRFDAVIEFERLTSHDVEIVIRQIFSAKMSELDVHERELVERAGLLGKLIRLNSLFTNVRSIQKYVEELVCLAIIRSS